MLRYSFLPGLVYLLYSTLLVIMRLKWEVAGSVNLLTEFRGANTTDFGEFPPYIVYLISISVFLNHILGTDKNNKWMDMCRKYSDVNHAQ